MLRFSKNSHPLVEFINGVDNFCTAMGEFFPIYVRLSTNEFQNIVEILFNSLDVDVTHVD